MNEIEILNKKIIECKKCPRLVDYIQKIAKEKVKRFSDETYWGRPLTGFGDFDARVLIVGLAPAAHGGNRTGRMFTGDSSGDWLAKALYENGFATKPSSQRIGDGFKLVDTYVTASVRCAPPDNKPSRTELDNCIQYLNEEFGILKNIKIIICLGRIAFDSTCDILNVKGRRFSHGNSFEHNNLIVLCSYHPSRQNTQTGRLSWEQWSSIFSHARKIIGKEPT